MRSTVTVLLLWGVIGWVAVAATAPEPLPSSDELHQLFKDKNYPDLLRKLNRVLELRGDAARPYDRVDLWLLKVDAHLAMKEQSLALTAAGAAVKAIDERTPPREAAVARTTELMIRRSRAWGYVPRNTPVGQAVQPLSIIDPEGRHAIFAAMFDDAKGDILAKVRTAKQSHTLGPVIEAVRAVSDLRVLEMASTGKDEESTGALNDLATCAHDVMARAVKDMAERRDKIDAAANDLQPLPLPVDRRTANYNDPALYRKVGLGYQEGKELKEMIATCDQIGVAARQFADLSKAAAPGLDEVRDASDKLAHNAKTTLEADYSGAFTK